MTEAAKSENQAFLILTNNISKIVIAKYKKIVAATGNLGDVFLLYHSKNKENIISYEEVKIETFTNEILSSLNYKPIRSKLLPGSNHFPVLKFFLEHPNYKHYWCIEDDVVFNGNWNVFFGNISPDLDYDFITSHIRRYPDVPRWSWWKTLSTPDEKIDKKEMLNCFNPVYRISNRALQFLHDRLSSGYSGHHEVLIPTLLKKAGYKMADLSTKDNHVTPKLSYCTLSTMRWKPVFFVRGFKRNKLYHPVKAEITFKQFLVYLKRTFYNQTEYLKEYEKAGIKKVS